MSKRNVLKKSLSLDEQIDLAVEMVNTYVEIKPNYIETIIKYYRSIENFEELQTLINKISVSKNKRAEEQENYQLIYSLLQDFSEELKSLEKSEQLQILSFYKRELIAKRQSRTTKDPQSYKQNKNRELKRKGSPIK